MPDYAEADATMTGKPLAEVDAVKQAEEATILKYERVVNLKKLEGEQVGALIEVKIRSPARLGFASVAERIYRFRRARTVYLVSGT